LDFTPLVEIRETTLLKESLLNTVLNRFEESLR
jgi:hypothetical protein